MAVLGWVSNLEESRGRLLEVVFWSLFAVSTLTTSVRLWLRMKFSKLQWDDFFLMFAYICFFVFTILTQVEINMGLGQHALDVPFSNLNALAVCGLAGLTVATVGITAAKISFAVTLLNLANNLWRWINWMVWGIIITLLLFAVPVAILPWVQCTPLSKTAVDFIPGKCIDKEPTVQLGIVQAVYSGVMDFLLALVPWKILWNLQMRPMERAGVGIAMSLGVVAGVMAILRATEVPKLATQDASYDGSISVLWGAIELATAIIAACIPALRKLLTDKADKSRSKAISRNTGARPTQRGICRLGASNNSGGNRTLVSSRDSDVYRLARFERLDGTKATSEPKKTIGSKLKSKHNTANKWYSAYERDILQDSDGSVLFQERDGDGFEIAVGNMENQDKLCSTGRGGNESSRWNRGVPSRENEAPADWLLQQQEPGRSLVWFLPLPTFPRPLSLNLALSSDRKHSRNQKGVQQRT